MRPFIGISCCIKTFGPAGSAPLPNHAASDSAVRAAADAAGAVPLLVPALGAAADINCLLDRLDGILLTGSRSMVSPCHYGGPPHGDDVPEDSSRDATTLPLIRAALARGIPVLAICRGLQELNVALGGTLHQSLAHLPGRLDHRAPVTDDVAIRFGKSHDVAFTAGGMLHRLAGAPTAMVNSLHHQGIDRLAPGLAVEAVAPDGTIEAVRLVNGPGFALGVQWHPEADWQHDTFSRRIFEAFGDAVRGPVEMPMAAD
jgi:putative glutamine amidotransferase